MKQDKNPQIRTSLRSYFTMVFLIIFGFACIFSTFLVVGAVCLLHRGPMTWTLFILMGCLICLFSIVFGGAMMWHGSAHLTKPLKEITDAVKKISHGDFSVHIQRNPIWRKDYDYSNEIDELAENVNLMTAELGSMDHMRKDFMSNVSHEFKTPIASMSGIAELLLDGNLSPLEQREYLELIHKESHRLSRLTENMLKLSRLSHQEIITRKEPFRIDEQIRKAIILISETWQDSPHEFLLVSEPFYYEGDPDLLMQIWMNLLDNAVKFSPVGSLIQIQVEKTEDSYIIRIQDQGIGISPKESQRIFEQFYQCEESHQSLGNGLGLSIVKRIVELLEGRIECQSTYQSSTTMILTLPSRL